MAAHLVCSPNVSVFDHNLIRPAEIGSDNTFEAMAGISIVNLEVPFLGDVGGGC